MSSRLFSTDRHAVAHAVPVTYCDTESICVKRNGYSSSTDGQMNGHPNGTNVVFNHTGRTNTRPRSHTSPLAAENRFTRYILDHQISLPMTVLSTIGVLTLVSNSAFLSHFFILSYYDPSTGLYRKGLFDAMFVVSWVLGFTLLRSIMMTYVFKSIAKMFGVKKQKALTRFAEQSWSFVYYSVSWTLGLYIIYHSPYWFQIEEAFPLEPVVQLEHLFKWYYLVQFAFWIQQIFVLNCEERRKDFWQMFLHHIITSVLLLMSYCYNQTRVGNVILCVMDFSDIWFSLAKMLRYLKMQALCDFVFIVFLVSWLLTRHIMFVYFIYETWLLAPAKGYGWDPANGIMLTRPVHYVFICLLIALQCVMCLWFYMILKVACRVILGGVSAEDSRSDDEDEFQDECEEPAPTGYIESKSLDGLAVPNVQHLEVPATTS